MAIRIINYKYFEILRLKTVLLFFVSAFFLRIGFVNAQTKIISEKEVFTTIYSNTKIHEKPTHKSKSITNVRKGEKIQIISFQNNFYEVKYKDTTGYVPGLNIRESEEVIEIKNNSDNKLVYKGVAYDRLDISKSMIDDSIEITEIEIYCQVQGQLKFFSGKVEITVDYGGYSGYFDSFLMDEVTGERIRFNSMVDALNFMGTQGWQFIQAYVVTTGDQNVYHYLMKKTVKLKKDE